MNHAQFMSFCASLPHARHVVQWGGADVWKVDVKVFAIAGWSLGERLAVTFKTSEVACELLKGEPGLRPAPYMASRGLEWIQDYADPGLADPDLRAYITESHRLAALTLPKKRRLALGFV